MSLVFELHKSQMFVQANIIEPRFSYTNDFPLSIHFLSLTFNSASNCPALLRDKNDMPTFLISSLRTRAIISYWW